jgi:hypothetical protein
VTAASAIGLCILSALAAALPVWIACARYYAPRRLKEHEGTSWAGTRAHASGTGKRANRAKRRYSTGLGTTVAACDRWSRLHSGVARLDKFST